MKNRMYAWRRYKYKNDYIDTSLHNNNGIIDYMKKNNIPETEFKNFKFVSQMVEYIND
tara:strand:+ start:365 stop:538 length:174 start_codon:yes stop_codon:yes gene_type:complete